MPGTRCAMYGCNNTYKQKEKNKQFSFHRFPKAKDSQTIRENWIVRCKRKDKFNPDTSFVCSVHFTENDYERDLRNELLGLTQRALLKKTAVPTLALHNKKPLTETSDARSKRLFARQSEQEVAKLLEVTMSSHPTLTKTEHISNPVPSFEVPDINHRDTDKEEYKEILLKYINLYEKYSLLNACIIYINKDASNNINIKKIKILNDQLRYYKNNFYRSPPSSKKSEMASLIDLLSRRKKQVNWTREEISIAFTLCYYSKKSYLYLRNKLHYPLPALTRSPPSSKKSETASIIDLLSRRKQVNWTREEISIAFTLCYCSKKSYLYLRNKLHYPLPALTR